MKKPGLNQKAMIEIKSTMVVHGRRHGREWGELVHPLLLRAIFVVYSDPLSFWGGERGRPQGFNLPSD